MNRQETVYALSAKGYFPSSRPSNHSTIVLANQRNVHLGFVRCNELWKGESKFENEQMEELYNRGRSLPTKSKMFQSQITNASTNANEEPGKRLEEMRNLAKCRRSSTKLVARSYHFGDQVYKVQNPQEKNDNQTHVYEYEQTSNIRLPQNFEDFSSLNKNNALRPKQKVLQKFQKQLKTIKNLMDEARLQKSFHLDDSQRQSPKQSQRQSEKNTLNSLQIKNKINIRNFENSSLSQKFTNTSFSENLQNNFDGYKTMNSATTISNQSKQSSEYFASQNWKTPFKTQNSLKVIETNYRDGHQNDEISYEQDGTKYVVKLSPVNQVTPSKMNGHFSLKPTFKVQSEKKIQYYDTSAEKTQKKYSQIDQINRLRMELAKKERQVTQYKNALQASEKKNKSLQIMVKKMEVKNMKTSNKYPLSINSYFKPDKKQICPELSKQIGGSTGALLYFTLFLVLLCKSEYKI